MKMMMKKTDALSSDEFLKEKKKKIVLKNQCTKSHLCDIKLACFDIL